jgi:DNA-binding SARP family transcriptional activator/tetratricopeptide (TPR) repeat protein
VPPDRGETTIRLLGPVQVQVCDKLLEIGPPRQRAVLAALAFEPGRAVQVDSLVDRVWGHRPPDKVREALYVYVGRIRKVLTDAGADAGIVRRSRAYLLDIDPDHVDLHRFGALLTRARQGDQADIARAASLRLALDDWLGPPLADVRGEWAARVRDAAQRQRLEATIEWAQTELRLGRAKRVIGPLTDLCAEHPLMEPLAATLMRALHADGRGAEALDCYTRIRRQMIDELGLDPGPDLQQVHRTILRGDLHRPAAAPTATAGAGGSMPLPRPAQLPSEIPTFTGRTDDLEQLDRLLLADAPTTVVISAVSGAGGIGKTALAVHWGHRVKGSFPDGQLFVNLRGFDPSGRAMSPAEAIRTFLEALGVPPERIPRGLEAQAAMYRTVLSGRRVLIVLDNARDAEQVRPMLPGTRTAVVVVTSRNQMPSLVAVDGAHPLALTPLTPEEARQLMARRLGPARTAAEPEALEEIITRCALLPLALTIAAARAVDPSVRLGAVASDLADASRRLDLLSAGDAVSDVRAVFSWSYATLTDRSAELFRLLGLHPGPDFTVAAAASLTGRTVEQTATILAELTAASLLTDHEPGRYEFHDLLRTYAVELVQAHDTEAWRRAALVRSLDHYLHTSHRADRHLHPEREPMRPALEPPAAGVTPERVSDHASALDWFAAERAVLVTATSLADVRGQDLHAWQLAWSLTTFLTRRGPWHDLTITWSAALAAADRLGDPVMRALAHRNLAHAFTELDRYDEARDHHRRALDLYAEVADHSGQAQTRRMLATLCERQGLLDQALEHVQAAFTLSLEAHQPSEQAASLNALGWYSALLGDHTQALAHCEQALTLFEQLSDRHGEADTWDSLGYVHAHLSDHDLAIACYQKALDLYRAIGDRYFEAATLIRLGETHEEATRSAWRHALDILTDLQHPVGDTLRAKLRDIGEDAPGRRESWLGPRGADTAVTAESR